MTVRSIAPIEDAPAIAIGTVTWPPEDAGLALDGEGHVRGRRGGDEQPEGEQDQYASLHRTQTSSVASRAAPCVGRVHGPVAGDVVGHVDRDLAHAHLQGFQGGQRRRAAGPSLGVVRVRRRDRDGAALLGTVSDPPLLFEAVLTLGPMVVDVPVAPATLKVRIAMAPEPVTPFVPANGDADLAAEVVGLEEEAGVEQPALPAPRRRSARPGHTGRSGPCSRSWALQHQGDLDGLPWRRVTGRCRRLPEAGQVFRAVVVLPFRLPPVSPAAPLPPPVEVVAAAGSGDGRPLGRHGRRRRRRGRRGRGAGRRSRRGNRSGGPAAGAALGDARRGAAVPGGTGEGVTIRRHGE